MLFYACFYKWIFLFLIRFTILLFRLILGKNCVLSSDVENVNIKSLHSFPNLSVDFQAISNTIVSYNIIFSFIFGI